MDVPRAVASLLARDTLLAQAAPALQAATTATNGTTQAGLLFAAVAVLAGVIVYLHTDARKERLAAAESVLVAASKAKLDTDALHAELAALRAAQVQAAMDAANGLVAVQKQHTAAMLELQSTRIASDTVTRDQLVHLVRQCAAVLTATGASLDAVQEINTEMLSSTRDLSGEVKRFLTRAPAK